MRVSRSTTTMVAALVMAALLVLYLVFTFQYALVLIGSGVALGVALGYALAVLPVVGAVVLGAELLFVWRGERLIKKLGAEGGLPVDDLPRLPSGRTDPVAADREFPHYRDEVEAAPESWRAWLRLGLAYDASGDRRRARWATRRAIALERAH
jgi:membrane protein implicated in regulation of membrane protease activity